MVFAQSGQLAHRLWIFLLVLMKRELWDLLWSEVALITFEINSTLNKFRDNVQEFDPSVPEIIRAVEVHEFPIIVIFPKDDNVMKLILYMIRHVSFAELGVKHGLSMNGKARGSLTRIVVNVARWFDFSIEELKPVHESINSREKRVPTANKVDILDAPPTNLVYDAKRLKMLISNKSFQPSLIEHILDLYERVKMRDASCTSLQVELADSGETIRLLQEGIHFSQRNLEACERRVSAQKGQRVKATNRLVTTIDALNLEAGTSRANLQKNYGYAKMKVTKIQNRLEKEKLELLNEKTLVGRSSMKLAVFEQLRMCIIKLNRLNATESMRRVLSVVLPLVIPMEEMRKGMMGSKASVAELLGFNEKSLLGKHVFDKSQALLSALQNNADDIKAFESAVLPVKRWLST